MQLPILLAIATLSTQLVYAAFVVITQPIPTPTAVPSFANAAESESFYGSLSSEFTAATRSWYSSLAAENATLLPLMQIASTQLRMFFASATYDIPSIVTAKGAETTFTTEPEWWTALPGGLRREKEFEASIQLSIMTEVLVKAGQAQAATSVTTANQTSVRATGVVSPTGVVPSNRTSTFTGVPADTISFEVVNSTSRLEQTPVIPVPTTLDSLPTDGVSSTKTAQTSVQPTGAAQGRLAELSNGLAMIVIVGAVILV